MTSGRPVGFGLFRGGLHYGLMAFGLAVSLVFGLSFATSSPVEAALENPHTTASGYDLVGADGGVFVFGGGFFGSLPGLGIHVSDVVGMAPAVGYAGYYLVGADGGVFSFGSTNYEGSLPGLGVAVHNIVGIVPSSDDRGYFLVGSDGGVFSFGDTGYEGSLPGLSIHVNDVTDIAATPDNHGYWVLEGNGQVYGFGDAPNLALSAPLPPAGAFIHYVGIASTTDGQGYWVVNNWGQVFAVGDARWLGNLPNPTQPPIISLVPTGDNAGYWEIGANGAVEPVGDASFHGSLSSLGITPSLPIVGGVPTVSVPPVTSPSSPPPPTPPSAITIDTTSLPPATVGQPYSATLNATSTAGTIVRWQTVDVNGNPVSYSNPAPGLSWGGVDSTTPGLTITGTPTKAETVTFYFEILDAAGNTARTGPYTLVINQVATAPLSVTPSSGLESNATGVVVNGGNTGYTCQGSYAGLVFATVKGGVAPYSVDASFTPYPFGPNQYSNPGTFPVSSGGAVTLGPDANGGYLGVVAPPATSSTATVVVTVADAIGEVQQVTDLWTIVGRCTPPG